MAAPADQAPTGARRILEAAGLWVSVAVLVLAGVLWWGTATSTTDARIAALQPIEAPAMAVHEQLIYNFAHHGDFRQTVHWGYSDTWHWSGHRAPTLALVSWPYSLDPSASWLSHLQILGVLLGLLPAALLGRRHLRSAWGLGLGGVLYLAYPPVMALALQDYQDIVFAVPCLVFALWAFGCRSAWLVALGALVGLLPREETVMLTVACAFIAVPWQAQRPYVDLRRYVRNVLLVGLIAAAYTAWATHYFPYPEGPHANPLAAVVNGLLEGRDLHWPGLKTQTPGFYELMFSPAAHPAALAPLHALPGLGLLALHVQVPDMLGVDRDWGEHAHHMAPAAGFLVAAIIVGAGRTLRLIGRVPRIGHLAAGLTALGVAAWTVRFDSDWARHYNLVVSMSTEPPEWTHPLWELAELLPEDAVPGVPTLGAITVSNRSTSYTYDGSLVARHLDQGLGPLTHILVDERHPVVLARALAMPGAEVLAEAGPYQLVTWRRRARDRSRAIALAGPEGVPPGRWPEDQVHIIPRLQPYVGPFDRGSAIPGVPPYR